MNMGDDFLRYSILLNLREYFKKFSYVKDLEMIDERLKFFVPFNRIDRVQFIAEHKKLFDIYKFTWYAYDTYNGFIVEIQ